MQINIKKGGTTGVPDVHQSSLIRVVRRGVCLERYRSRNLPPSEESVEDARDKSRGL